MPSSSLLKVEVEVEVGVEVEVEVGVEVGVGWGGVEWLEKSQIKPSQLSTKLKMKLKLSLAKKSSKGRGQWRLSQKSKFMGALVLWYILNLSLLLCLELVKI